MFIKFYQAPGFDGFFALCAFAAVIESFLRSFHFPSRIAWLAMEKSADATHDADSIQRSCGILESV